MDLCQGMAYLYQGLGDEKRIYNFDIKPGNILYLNGNYLITDFGVSYVKNKLINFI
jgi:serine/threonine protein kinase